MDDRIECVERVRALMGDWAAGQVRLAWIRGGPNAVYDWLSPFFSAGAQGQARALAYGEPAAHREARP